MLVIMLAQWSVYASLAATVSIIRDPNKSVLEAQRRAALRRCIAHSVTRVRCAGQALNSLMAHPDDCSLFYHCYNELAVPICNQCPLSWTFNPVKRACDPLSQHYCAAPLPRAAPASPAATGTTEANKETLTQQIMKFPEVTLH